MEELVAGMTKTGTWKEVVEHGEKITAAIEEKGFDSDDEWFVAWNSWRPKIQEEHQSEMRLKTAEHASKTLTHDKSPERRIPIIIRSLQTTASEAGNGDFRTAMSHAGKAAQNSGTLALRTLNTIQSKVEGAVYKNVMTSISPYYFDNEKINANLSYDKRDREYTLQVSISIDDLHNDIVESVKEYNKNINRWHVSAEKNVQDSDSIHRSDGEQTETIQPEEVKEINQDRLEE